MRLSLSNPRTTQPWSQGDRNERETIHREKNNANEGLTRVQFKTRGEKNEIHENGKPRYPQNSPLVVDKDTREKILDRVS